MLCILTYHPQKDVIVLLQAPRNSLNEEGPALLDLLGVPISNEQGVLETLRPVCRQVVTHSVGVLEVEHPPAHIMVEQIAKPINQSATGAIGDVELVCQRIVWSALTSFGECHDKQIGQ